MSDKLRVAIVVHGRWDAFDLARALAARGVEVGLYTNYPSWAVARFGVPPASVRSFWPHGVLARGTARLPAAAAQGIETVLHPLFGHWAARRLRAEQWDVAYVFSGVAEEVFRALGDRSTLKVLVRESSHIRTQDALLAEEEQRTGVALDRPGAWMIGREEREYALTDVIRVLSTFTYESFVARGVPATKVKLVVSGASLERFRPSPGVVDARCQRLLSGAPLRVLTVGSFTMRKGVWDSAAILRALGTENFTFRFVGPVATDARALAERMERAGAEFVPKQPEAALPDAYAWGDVFLLPTIEDGFQAVLGQAAASGLPILTTPNGAGRDLVSDDRSGWVLPVRCPDAFAERLRWASTHRADLVRMVRETYEHFQPRDFADVAADLETMLRVTQSEQGRVPLAVA